MQEKIGEFLEHLKVVRRFSPETIRAYRADLEQFFQVVGRDILSKEAVREFFSLLQRERKKRSSLLRKASSLRSFSRYLHEKRYLQRDPLQALNTPKREKLLPKAIGYEELLIFFAQPNLARYLGLRDRAIMELLYSSALRVSELVGLLRDDWKKKRGVLLIRGKGNKERIVPITDTAAQWVEKYLTHPDRIRTTKTHQKEQDPRAIFLNKWGRQLSSRSVVRVFSQYHKSSGLSAEITPHTLRHSVATHWLERGMDLESIRYLLGHESLSATTVYTKVSQKLQQKEYAKFHPLAEKECEKW